MNMILMGPPGAGKGTQAEFIKAQYPIPHISTGDIFREAVGNKTPLGMEAKKYMDQGKLVPDEVTIGIVAERLAQADCQPGFLLDGFPRTIVQADALQEVLVGLEKGIDAVINIYVPNEILISRITNRVSCRECKVVYNLQSNPPAQPGVCDKCGGELFQRSDDQGDTVLNRLQVYSEQTDPLLDYYRSRGLLHNIDGDRESSVVFADVQGILENLK
ncbi:MAG TPA: adenylate kinase [Syntrophomonadaceae bacterium]|nr:adenylate kinase [Syntrophomonadaceae bacterium]